MLSLFILSRFHIFFFALAVQVTLIGSNLYVFGGEDVSRKLSNNLYILDLEVGIEQMQRFLCLDSIPAAPPQLLSSVGCGSAASPSVHVMECPSHLWRQADTQERTRGHQLRWPLPAGVWRRFCSPLLSGLWPCLPTFPACSGFPLLFISRAVLRVSADPLFCRTCMCWTQNPWSGLCPQ